MLFFGEWEAGITVSCILGRISLPDDLNSSLGHPSYGISSCGLYDGDLHGRFCAIRPDLAERDKACLDRQAAACGESEQDLRVRWLGGWR